MCSNRAACTSRSQPSRRTRTPSQQLAFTNIRRRESRYNPCLTALATLGIKLFLSLSVTRERERERRKERSLSNQQTHVSMRALSLDLSLSLSFFSPSLSCSGTCTQRRLLLPPLLSAAAAAVTFFSPQPPLPFQSLSLSLFASIGLKSARTSFSLSD